VTAAAMTDAYLAQLKQALATLSNRTASSGELKAAAELARKAVSEIDAEHDSAPAREAEILAVMTSKALVETLEALEALDKVGEQRALMRKIGTALAAALDTRARDAEKAEEARNKARSPFQSQTRRAQELAKAFEGYPALASRVVELFVTDIAVRRLAKSAYSSVPRDPGSRAISRVDSFDVPLRSLGRKYCRKRFCRASTRETGSTLIFRVATATSGLSRDWTASLTRTPASSANSPSCLEGHLPPKPSIVRLPRQTPV
jgi:hypothetical protein